MCSYEFGIIDDLQEEKDYGLEYEPRKYHCISIDDDIINNLAKPLSIVKTYHHSLKRPELDLAYYGITLIPPESLGQFMDIVLSSKRIQQSEELNELINIISEAIKQNKYIIHYGI